MNKILLKIGTSYIKTEKDKKCIASFIHEMSDILKQGGYEKVSTVTDKEFQIEIYKNGTPQDILLVRNVIYNERLGAREDTYTLFKVTS